MPVSKFIEKQAISTASLLCIVRLCNKRCPLLIQSPCGQKKQQFKTNILALWYSK